MVRDKGRSNLLLAEHRVSQDVFGVEKPGLRTKRVEQTCLRPLQEDSSRPVSTVAGMRQELRIDSA